MAVRREPGKVGSGCNLQIERPRVALHSDMQTISEWGNEASSYCMHNNENERT